MKCNRKRAKIELAKVKVKQKIKSKERKRHMRRFPSLPPTCPLLAFYYINQNYQSTIIEQKPFRFVPGCL